MFYTSCFIHGIIAMALPSQVFTKHLFKLNYIFKSFNTNLLSESKLAYNLDMWNACSIQIWLILPFIIVSTIRNSISMAKYTFYGKLCILVSYLSNGNLCLVADESMIHLCTLLECIHVCITNALLISSFIFFAFSHYLFFFL